MLDGPSASFLSYLSDDIIRDVQLKGELFAIGRGQFIFTFQTAHSFTLTESCANRAAIKARKVRYPSLDASRAIAHANNGADNCRRPKLIGSFSR